MGIIDRITEFRKSIALGQTALEIQIGVSRGYLSNVKTIGSDKIMKISEVFPELNINWLITGKGEMLNSPSVNKTSQLSKVIAALEMPKSEFAKKIGVKEYNVDKMLSGELPIGANTLRKLESVFSVNPEWITRGTGEMFINEEATPKTSVNTHLPFHAIKYYPSVNGSMGGVEFLDNPNETSTDIVIPGFSDCKFAVNAYGDSMHPIIKSGQIVVMMEWTESFIDWGRIYFVVTKNGYRAIKYLRPSDKEGYIKCVSENSTENPEFDIEMNDIHKLFLVKGWICREAI